MGRRDLVTRLGELMGQLPLVADFEGHLPDLVHPQGRFGLLQARGRLVPCALQLGKGLSGGGIGLAFQQDGTPCQPNGQELAQVAVLASF